MKSVLILFAHPAFHKSRINRIIARPVQNMPGVTFHDLYEAYPQMDIDAAAEQELLVRHDVVVFQHPLFWYSIPAILKEWQDLVLEHGWAYGSTGKALAGKKWMHVITAGGGDAAYQKGGFNEYTIRDFLIPLQQTARLCRMDFLPPFVAHGTHAMTDDDARIYADNYARIISAIHDDRIKWDQLKNYEVINQGLSDIIIPSLRDIVHG